jgi:hypothetical protein
MQLAFVVPQPPVVLEVPLLPVLAVAVKVPLVLELVPEVPVLEPEKLHSGSASEHGSPPGETEKVAKTTPPTAQVQLVFWQFTTSCGCPAQ